MLFKKLTLPRHEKQLSGSYPVGTLALFPNALSTWHKTLSAKYCYTNGPSSPDPAWHTQSHRCNFQRSQRACSSRYLDTESIGFSGLSDPDT